MIARILKQPWILVLAVTVLGWVWTLAGERAVFETQLEQLQHQIETLHRQKEVTGSQLTNIHGLLKQVQTDVKWIHEELSLLRHNVENPRP